VNEHREHVPNRPGWDCWSCEQPWPCDPAREQLAQQLDPVALAEFMGERMIEAARDLDTVQPQELFERFLEWTWQVSPPGGQAG
jgi:hypothetical protein